MNDNNNRIIDPFYGDLKPLDLIQPYRLEMASKNILPASQMKDHKSLASWWSSSIMDSILQDLEMMTTQQQQPQQQHHEKVVLNLASDEYSAVMNPNRLKECGVQYIKIVFRQEGRVIAVHAKRARGLMARYVAERGIVNVEDVKGFDLDGYSFVSSQSSEDSLVFDRKKPEGKPSATTKKRKGGNNKSSTTTTKTTTSKKSRKR